MVLTILICSGTTGVPVSELCSQSLKNGIEPNLSSTKQA